MRLSLAFLVAGLVACPFAAPALAAEAPTSLEGLKQSLDDLARRIDAIIVEANKDPDEHDIDTYEAYSFEEMHQKKRAIRAEKLVGFMVDPEKNFNIRQRAQKAIKEGAQFRGDPDFSRAEKHGPRSKRAYFCDKYLIDHLEHKDAKSRKLTNELLNVLWRVNSVPAIIAYDVNDKKTWSKSRKAWQRFLRRN
jgi:hypothetical protein